MSWERLTRDADRIARRRPADDLLQEILEQAEASGWPSPSLEIGRLLEVLAGERGVERILEVGTGLGFYAVCLARGAPSAELMSIPGPQDPVDSVRSFLERAEVVDRVRLVDGEPLASVDHLEQRFQLIHIGMPVEELRRLVDRLLPQLEVGGLLTAGGLVPGDEVTREERDRAKAVAGYLVMHPQLDCSVLPIGRGLAVGRKKRPVVTEMGGPF